MVFQKRDRASGKDNRQNGGAADGQTQTQPDKLSQWPVNGLFGVFGGRHVPEILHSHLDQLQETFATSQNDDNFQRELKNVLSEYAGRQTGLYYAKRLTRAAGGARIYLKREDLGLYGLTDLSVVIGQLMLAKQLKKQRLITAAMTAEQILATAAAVTAFGYEVKIMVGQRDYDAAKSTIDAVQKMGIRVQAVQGQGRPGGIQEAVESALNEWTSNIERSHLIMTSPIGPHPLPWIVREFGRVVGDELKGQILRKERRLPDQIMALYRTGGLALGTFAPFIDDEDVKLVAVEMMERTTSQNPLLHGKEIVTCGMKSLCYERPTSVDESRSGSPISIGVVAGPELAFYHSKNSLEYAQVTSEQAKDGFQKLLRAEGIFASDESSYVLHALLERAKQLGSDGLIVGVLTGASHVSTSNPIEDEEPKVQRQAPDQSQTQQAQNQHLQDEHQHQPRSHQNQREQNPKN